MTLYHGTNADIEAIDLTKENIGRNGLNLIWIS